LVRSLSKRLNRITQLQYVGVERLRKQYRLMLIMWNSWLMYTLAHSLACASWSSFHILRGLFTYTYRLLVITYKLSLVINALCCSARVITVNYRKCSVGCIAWILANKPRTFEGVYPSRQARKLFISILGIRHTQPHTHHA